ncbi:MAG TPA: outer membrane protein assembly factor [Prolixibacteraceae bacterium]|nr:outer membrane protein assembly factor [Prolixibacteraceae bacterium]
MTSILSNIISRVKFLHTAILLSGLLLFSCSPVKFVPEDKYLISKVQVEIDNEKMSKESARVLVKQKENYKILGFFKFHLHVYNLSSKKKQDDWLKRIGEAPQVYDEGLAQKSEEQLIQYAHSKGFFKAEVQTDLKLKEKKRKAELVFNLKAGEQYTIQRINYQIKDSVLQELYFNSTIKPNVKPGDAFDIENLEKHQADIVKLFKENGYFYFSKDDVKFIADSSVYSKQVLVDLLIRPAKNSQLDSSKVFQPFYLNNFYISVLPGNSPVTVSRDSASVFSDTLVWGNSTLYQNDKVKYPPALFDRTLQLKKGALYNNSEVENAFNAFTRLRQFRFVDIQFAEVPAVNDSNLLDCYIRLAPLNKQATSFDIEGTNTSGNFGVAGNLTYQHRNLFRGAEVFQMSFRGGVERLQNQNNGSNFNTTELGVETSLMIPQLLGPGSFIHQFERFLPKTVITLGYNYQRRPEYTRTISNVKFGYDWKSTEDIRHIWNVLDYNKVKVYDYDPEFIEGIRDLYIKSSFTDHLIFAMNYSWIFNNQRLTKIKNYTYVRFNVESSGNLLWAISELANRDKYQEVDSLGNIMTEYYQAFNTRFAQYVKGDFEYSRSFIIDKFNSIVGRTFLGIGIPFGNFDVLPFEKKYFSGGANGIRAWPVRSLGPGTYKASSGEYPNQTADIKLEANLEYRFKLIAFIEGALFIDAGNIWAINEKDNRLGAQFKFNSFYKQLALGTGTGLRFDMSYFILRLDLGMKLRDPSVLNNNGWIIGSRQLTSNDFNFTFAIGYPF